MRLGKLQGNCCSINANYVIFAAMAARLKNKPAKNPKSKPMKSGSGGFQADKEEKIDLKSLAKDERIWKIIGTVSLFLSIFLFTAFISYFFTWKEDFDKVFGAGTSILFNSDIKVSNLLGRMGALVSHFFIYKGFGVASLLICTFFFVAGVNLLFNRKVYSLWRNLKYVTIGLLVLSASLAFLLPNSDFPFGGGVGVMISNWFVDLIGNLGTAVLLLVIAVAYIIWQFNPSFDFSTKKKETESESELLQDTIPVEQAPAAVNKTINDLYAETNGQENKGNFLKKEGGMLQNEPTNVEKEIELTVIEKEEIMEEDPVQASIEKEIVSDILHQHDLGETPEVPAEKKVYEKTVYVETDEEPELEIKQSANEESAYENLPPYEPTLDLRDYKYPTLNMLETHGSEKIILDANELENNKTQIISTLRNYDIEIQKISATVGPTVTLYEIVPAPGIRISKIKNLEDDIALSLAALGIRIIAPIPGKGTIGIEVPNVKKTLVSMKTMLASEKFQHNTYSLPIALGKKIDNENFIVDLTSMPHLLMAGATGQGKSVGINAILVSLLYKKHPSQLKFVLIDPKKVELNIFRHIEKHFLAKLPGEEEAIITDTKKVVHTLNALCIEMDNRYDLLKEAGARNIKEYNEKFIKRKLNPLKGHQFLPFIVLVIDEFADLIMSAGKEIELPIARLAQLARAVGLHLIIATQRPSVNIITGTIKANFPCRWRRSADRER
jgi:S-DNA-T family DNA segregation ATPase FtsK/SpoIIIE